MALQKVLSMKTPVSMMKMGPPPSSALSTEFKNALRVEEACTEVHSGAGTVVGIKGMKTFPTQVLLGQRPAVGRGPQQRGSVDQ